MKHTELCEKVIGLIDALRMAADEGETLAYDDLQYLTGYVTETADNLGRRGERYYEKEAKASAPRRKHHNPSGIVGYRTDSRGNRRPVMRDRRGRTVVHQWHGQIN